MGQTPAQPLGFQASVRAVKAHTARLGRLEQDRQEQGTSWHLSPVGDALQARRGVQCTVAVTRVAAIGAFTRFEHPRALRQCLGLVPSESATGERRRPGAIPKAGNPHARRGLVEGA
ncbi:MAG TPA: transposase [Candidatus Tectomicrobia bacterium]